ncbi:GNAT family N-acetyltransferase [Clostridium sp. YIM B02515]|uniref:GNAT family N-acetyltransferase n=1 Tax=Clostridium rhizosphaerae TaxID=2803861 RepID=A0ABS1TGF2_9CLOT|nr:GNAT family N-acetyltransferase [Clostridium rhizosphaerae]MBL4937686.1 GNAT family N-acetyltransferase [Clostridium rhizosphaerae]
MKIDIIPVGLEDKEILRNLLEKYDYEFSQYDDRDVNKLGLYGYDYLDNYWTEKNRWAFFITVDDKLAGFSMVNDFPETKEETDYSLAEFFIMYKYRRMGVGKYAVKRVFDMFKGRWQLKRHPKNLASVYFWDNVVSEYTNNNYRLVKAYPETEYADGTLGDIYFFDNLKGCESYE